MKRPEDAVGMKNGTMQNKKIVLIFILSAALLGSCYPVKIVSQPRPVIFIIRLEPYRLMEGRTVYLLEYAVDGKFESPGFNTPEDAEEYLVYLQGLGKVTDGRKNVDSNN